MKKKLDVDALANELTGKSLFFNQPKTEASQIKDHSPTLSKSTAEQPNSKNRTGRTQRTVSKKKKEKRIRCAFELYPHHVQKIVEASQVLAKENGAIVNKSEVIRTALDAYFRKIGV